MQAATILYKLLIVPCFQSRVRIFLPAEWKLAGRVRRSRGPGCGSAGSEEAGLGRLPFIRQALGCQVKYERTSSFMFDGNMHWASSTLGSMLGTSNAPSNPNFSANFNDSTLCWSSMPTALNALIQVVRGNTLAMVSAIICNQSAVETDPSIASDFLFRHPFQKVFLNMAKRCVSQGCRNAVSLAGMYTNRTPHRRACWKIVLWMCDGCTSTRTTTVLLSTNDPKAFFKVVNQRHMVWWEFHADFWRHNCMLGPNCDDTDRNNAKVNWCSLPKRTWGSRAWTAASCVMHAR